MNFKKRLIFTLITVILVVPYFFYNDFFKIADVPGPTHVEGWYLNTSRNTSDYIKENIEPLIIPKYFCKEKGILLVMINVKPDRFEARQTIRETWASKRENVSFYFLLGEDKDRNYELQLKIREESRKYNDIIQEQFIDSYNNLTLKSINMLKLFNLHCSKNFQYLLKIDDDVFLNVPLMIEYISSRTNHTDVLMGKIMNCTKPFRNPDSKWYVPYEFYRDEFYPDYICGPSYLMSADVADKLYRCSYETPLFFIEDAYITGICAKKKNITPTHNSKFICIPVKKYICLHRHSYTLHFFQPLDIRRAYKTLNGEYCPTEGSFMEWITSLFYF